MPAGTDGEPATRPTSPWKRGFAGPGWWFRLEAAKVERAWAVVSARRDGLSIRKTAEAIGLGATRVHQLLASPDAAGWEARLDLLRTHGWPAPEDPPDDAASGDTIAERMADEAQALRDVTEWLDKLVRTGMPELVDIRPRSDLRCITGSWPPMSGPSPSWGGSPRTSTSLPGPDASLICPPRLTMPIPAYGSVDAWPSRPSRCPGTGRRTSSGAKPSSGSSMSTTGRDSPHPGVGEGPGIRPDRSAN